MWNESNTKLTLELRELIESGVDPWDFEYPSYYKGDDKKNFEKLVIDHYFFRQIGQETTARWLHYFRTLIREIMPYYIKLYESVDLMANVGDPFQAYDLTETFEKQGTGQVRSSGSSSSETSESSEGSTTTNGTRKFSNTPQGSIENLDRYMTEATKEDGDTTDNRSVNGTSSSSSDGESESSETESYTLRRFGNIGVQPLGQEMEYYRKALINVDMMVIEELNDLFLKVY